MLILTTNWSNSEVTEACVKCLFGYIQQLLPQT